ncbi:hypothetical protein [Chryseobacterium ginsengisoli]
MSTSSTDSTAADNARTASPSVTDTMTTKTANPDTIKMKMDSATAVK